MKMVDFQTIKPLDYALAKASLAGLPKEQAAVIEQMIRDHMVICKHQEVLIRIARRIENTLFDANLGREAERSPAPSPDAGDSPDSGPLPVPNPSPDAPSKPKMRPVKHQPKPDALIHHGVVPCACSLCGKGMVSGKTKTRTLFVAKPFLMTERHEFETLRCTTCGSTAEAQKPPALTYAVGRYAPSVVASLAALRYMFGMPSLRMETLCATMGVRVSDSTQWSLFEEAASRVRAFHTHLKTVVANAPVKHFDDTSVLILSVREQIRAAQEKAIAIGKKPESVRSGVHTSVSCAVLPEQGKVVLFASGLHHCGEITGKLLERRSVDETLVLMADSSSANTAYLPVSPTYRVIVANCNSHVVRKFRELAENFPDAATFFEQAYAQVFRNDAHCRNESLSPAERLDYHRQHSLPIMEAMATRATVDIESRLVEPNSTLGKVYAYFKNHYESFIAFCCVENAPVCNNLAERMLKAFIRQRKASLFFRNSLGSAVADILSSLLITAYSNEINPVRYLEVMLLHPHLLRSDPDAFLPWNFKARFGEDPPPNDVTATTTE
jgi:transposase